MLNCSKPVFQLVLGVTPIKQSLHEQHFHVFKIGWQSIGDSISLQLSLDEALENTTPVKGMPWNVHVLVMRLLVSANFQAHLLTSTICALADSDVHIVNARLTVLPCKADVRQYAIQQMQGCNQTGLILLPNKEAIIYESLIDAGPVLTLLFGYCF